MGCLVGKCRARRGGSLVETAIVLPVLMSVAFGTIEFGYFFFVKHALQGAAREGARAAIVSGSTNADVTSAVNNAISKMGLTSAQYTTTTTPTTIAGVAEGTSVTVTVSGSWGAVGIRPLSLISSGKAVTGVCVMRHE